MVINQIKNIKYFQLIMLVVYLLKFDLFYLYIFMDIIYRVIFQQQNSIEFERWETILEDQKLADYIFIL